jgi:hyperosmotically inducible periplasmic protein
MLRKLTVLSCGVALMFATAGYAGQSTTQEVKDKTQTAAKKTAGATKKGASKTGEVVSDASITTAVKTRLMKDKAARAASIDVNTDAGVVTIAGAVPTQADKTRIAALVRHTTGVKSVTDNLTVSAVGTSGRPDTTARGETKKGETKVVVKDDTTPKIKKGTAAVSDASVTTAVKTRLMTDEVARGTSIDVDTNAGVVTLAGTVPTAADRARIGQLVLHTTGVKKVVNKLTVK